MNKSIIKTNNQIIHFPKECFDHKYYPIHFYFFIQYAKIAKINIMYIESTDKVFVKSDNNSFYFSCLINNKQVIFDYNDLFYRDWVDENPNIKYFKFQSTKQSSKKVIPLGPPIVSYKNKQIQTVTIRTYLNIKKSFNYKPGPKILCKQIPNGGAIERRTHVHDLIQTNFKDYDIEANSNQVDFWKSHEDSTIAVCVPGATNNMIDRGQMELFGLGVCTISPELHTRLPYDVTPIPGVHYLKCKDDYSDLIDVIKHAQSNHTLCKSIGNGARYLFNNNFMPAKYWKWILQNI